MTLAMARDSSAVPGTVRPRRVSSYPGCYSVGSPSEPSRAVTGTFFATLDEGPGSRDAGRG